VPNRKS